MMVNQYNSNPVSWQNTVPQQMPWMSSYDPASLALQFGQQSMPVNPNILLQQAQHLPTNANNPNEILTQHPSLAHFPTATTLTAPLTSCPTSVTSNPVFMAGMSMPSGCCTNTTQSSQMLQNFTQPSPDFQATQLNFLNNNSLITPHTSSQYNPTNSLTQLPTTCPAKDNISPHKRTSTEMEDDMTVDNEPPTKQLLSEKKLFKKFGSLFIDGNGEANSKSNDSSSSVSSDDFEEDERSQLEVIDENNERQEFNRYVYLLFKDKKGSSSNPFIKTNDAIDRLARDERDKLSKAVILWSPSLKDQFFGNNDEDSDDEEFRYQDHKDFLKSKANDSIIITEVTDDEPSMNVNNDFTITDADDVMLE